MSTNIDLNKLEQKAYRTNFQDGLWDIFLGLLLFQSVIDLVLYELDWPPAVILLTTLGYVVLVLIGPILLVIRFGLDKSVPVHGECIT